MRVLLLSQFYAPVLGGEERHVEGLAHALAGRGHAVCVATQAAGGAPAHEERDGVAVRRLGSSAARIGRLHSGDRAHSPPVPDPEFALRLLRVARQFRPDVVHAHNWAVNSWLAVKPLVRVPLVLTLHDYGMRCATQRLMLDDAPCPGPRPRRCVACAGRHYGRLVGGAIAAANGAIVPLRRRMIDHAICVSRAVASGNGLDALAIPYTVIPNFAPAEVPEPAGLALPAAILGEPFLLFVGDVTIEKGVGDLLAAYRAIVDPPPLVLIGRGGAAVPSDLPGVTVLAGVPHPVVMAAFRRCLLSIAPSRWPDPCPTVVWEAMLAGKPVVTTAHGGMVDQVEDGVTGFLVTPGDRDALRDRITSLVDDAGLRGRLGAAARERVRTVGVHAVTSRIEDVYAAAIAGSR